MAVLKSPHLETIPAQMQSLLSWLGEQAFLQRFYLAGGTCLALHLGHRRSVDLDFFSETDQVHDQTRREIISNLARRNGQVIENADGNLVLLVDGIHVTLLPSKEYPYPISEKQKPFFKAGGLDLDRFFLGALNVSIVLLRFEMYKPEVTFPLVAWTDLHPPETFSFSNCKVRFQDQEYEGLVYYPHSETKIRHL